MNSAHTADHIYALCEWAARTRSFFLPLFVTRLVICSMYGFPCALFHTHSLISSCVSSAIRIIIWNQNHLAKRYALLQILHMYCLAAIADGAAVAITIAHTICLLLSLLFFVFSLLFAFAYSLCNIFHFIFFSGWFWFYFGFLFGSWFVWYLLTVIVYRVMLWPQRNISSSIAFIYCLYRGIFIFIFSLAHRTQSVYIMDKQICKNDEYCLHTCEHIIRGVWLPEKINEKKKRKNKTKQIFFLLFLVGVFLLFELK